MIYCPKAEESCGWRRRVGEQLLRAIRRVLLTLLLCVFVLASRLWLITHTLEGDGDLWTGGDSPRCKGFEAIGYEVPNWPELHTSTAGCPRSRRLTANSLALLPMEPIAQILDHTARVLEQAAMRLRRPLIIHCHTSHRICRSPFVACILYSVHPPHQFFIILNSACVDLTPWRLDFPLRLSQYFPLL